MANLGYYQQQGIAGLNPTPKQPHPMPQCNNAKRLSVIDVTSVTYTCNTDSLEPSKSPDQDRISQTFLLVIYFLKNACFHN